MSQKSPDEAQQALDERRAVEQQLRALRRERGVWVSVAVLALAVLLLQRIGTRVWAIAIEDRTEHAFVETVYLSQKAQARAALELVRQRAQAAHPYYGSAEGQALFARSAPDFEQRTQLVPTRRLVELPARAAVQAPASAAADVLAHTLKVVVNAWGIYDEKAKRFVAVLPTKELAELATTQRIAAVTKRVESELRGHDHLVRAEFLQQVSVKPALRWPVARVLTLPQATTYLTMGDTRDAERAVQPNESARDIAAKFGTRLDELSAWNPGRDLNRLKPGDHIVVRRPEAPLTVLTVEARTYHEEGQVVTVEVRRHDGVETNRQEVDRRPAS